MNGILLIDKPRGLSSFDVIRRLRQVFKLSNPTSKPPKLGHAGTLDPMATGLLIILVGDTCKQASQFLKLDKSYLAELTLGADSTTDDAEGELTLIKPTKPNSEDIKKVLKRFVGEIQQLPPQHSAIKVGGKRAYNLARQGKSVELSERAVTVYELRLKKYAYPVISLDTAVSSGTYIRSLARDIGQKLGTGAYLSSLRRTKIGSYEVQNSVQLEGLSEQIIKKNIIGLQ